MGNKKNLNRKSKRKANNWRGIIKTRKQKTKLNLGDSSMVRGKECNYESQSNFVTANINENENEIENRITCISEDQRNVAKIHSIEFLGHCKFVIHESSNVVIKETQEAVSHDNNGSSNVTNISEVENSSSPGIIYYERKDEFIYDFRGKTIDDGLTTVPDYQPGGTIIRSIVPLVNESNETILSENQPKPIALIDHINEIDGIVVDDLYEVGTLSHPKIIQSEGYDEFNCDGENNTTETIVPLMNTINVSEDQPKSYDLVNEKDRFIADDMSEAGSLVTIIDWNEDDDISDNQPGVASNIAPTNTNHHSGNIEAIGGDTSETQASNGSHHSDIETMNVDSEVQAQLNLDNVDFDRQTRNDGELFGRRIVDISNYHEQIKQLSRHSETCHFEDMVCKQEVRKGLLSIFEFQCTVCGHEGSTYSCNYGLPINLNHAAVLGITSIGLGSYHLNEFCANLEIPSMSNYMYDTIQKKQQEDWWQLAQKEVRDALNEEIRLAILNGDVDCNGNVLIVVVAAGSWPKRSYNTNFTSLSGCAVLIGFRTNKVIYFDVKDKYCHVCKIAESKNLEPKEHKCNKNYVGPASAMETAIVIEGFRACEKLGVRFKEFVSDGDSSSFKTICDQKIYENPSMSTEKDDCCNHLYRNFRKAWKALSKAAKKFQATPRKLLTKKKGNDICMGVQTAAKYWRSSNVDTVEKLINLEKDVLNAPLHYFGIHDNCSEYFCTKKTEPEAITVINMLKSSGLYNEILNLCQTFFGSSVPSLLLNYNNNWAESFNNLVAKYTAGKRIQYCLAKSYRSRVARSVVQYNTGGYSGSAFHKFKESTSTLSLKSLEECRKRKVEKNAVAKASKPKRGRFTEHVHDKGVGYGENCQTNDLPTKMYEIAKARFLEPLQEDQRNWDFVNRCTIGQRLCRTWRDKRFNLLTSWYFSRVINVRGPQSYTNLCKEIIYTKTEYSNTAAIRHQRINENEALRCFTLKHGSNYISETGLFIDMEHCFLEASPFRLYGDNGIICIKCPLIPLKKNNVKTINEAIDAKLIPFWKKISGVLTVNRNSEWYIEI